MSGISDREKAFENKFAHDQELKFKAEARRNKLLGCGQPDFWARPMPKPMPRKWSPPISRKPAMKTFSAR